MWKEKWKNENWKKKAKVGERKKIQKERKSKKGRERLSGEIKTRIWIKV